MAVANGRILGLGNASEVQTRQVAVIGPNTKIVDLEGKFVTPGLIDSHVHFINRGLQMTYIQLGNANSRDEFTRRLKLAAEGVKEGKWIIGEPCYTPRNNFDLTFVNCT